MSRFGITIQPVDKDCTIIDNDVRVSVLSDRIIRVERATKDGFLDKPTQIVMCRNFAKPQFNAQKMSDKLRISTNCRVFDIDLDTLVTSVTFDGITRIATNKTNLGGTARTLDGTFGVVRSWKHNSNGKDKFFFANIRKGIFASNGVAELDDCRSYILEADGSVTPRAEGAVDKYILAFGDDYIGGLKEYYSLTGYTPLLPKYALGNWWSRYHAYTDEEYLALMDKFEQRDIPLSVATIDMDWHIVKNVPKDVPVKSIQGAGWTGYTVEKSLFPDFKAFLKNLKSRGLAITLNLHPRDGVRYFEEQYEAMAKACGIDPKTKQTVEFDLTDVKFRNAYFDILHHPYEKDGVDFWWIDWQQGTKSKMKGLDPLWLLNHYHFADVRREGRQDVILSRYAGLGSHRYPLGFSGDTMVCWKSLRLQPWFTSTASNAGYSWWSHDIGGHMFGHGDAELYLRWVQYGVFSPINRLHSNNKALSKEPWNYPNAEKSAVEFLRLRHRLLPYLYTANVLTAKEGIPLVAPLYYYDKSDNAYSERFRNEYYFGSEMLIAPITDKSQEGISQLTVWLPKGNWTDFFTGEKYVGGKEYTISRTLEQYPVFVKSGAIVPMLAERTGNSTSFDELEVRVYSGNGNYRLCDEQGGIDFAVSSDGGKTVFDVKPTLDCQTKTIKVVFCDIKSANITVNGEAHGIGNSVSIECSTAKIVLEN